MGNSTEESVSVAHKQKTCSQCKKTRSVDEFDKDKTRRDGLSYHCKVCRSKYKKRSRNFSVDPNLKEKTCPQCKKMKSVDGFSKDKKNRDGLNYYCKVCTSKYQKSRNFSVDPNLKEKTCTQCKKMKSGDEFYEDKKNRDGLTYECRVCTSKYQKSRNFSVDSNLKEKTCPQCKKMKSVDGFSKDKRRPDGLDYRCKVCKSEYEKDNRDKTNKRIRQRRLTDPKYKLSTIIRSQTNNIVKATKLKKTKQSFEYLGCTYDEFEKHIESQFVEGMSWENHGNDYDNTKHWHIDHIIPVSYFVKYSDDPFEANNYRNQRPMWGKENISKGDTLDMELVKEYGIEDLLPTKMTWQEN
jgi:hypothetical protein